MNAHIYMPLALMLAALSGGIFMMVVNLRKARTIEDTPAAKIRSAAQGFVSISGFARSAHGLLQAPLTGTPCLWFSYRIDRRERTGKRSHWNTIESGTSDQLFALDDRTGLCHVDPRQADVTAAMRQRWHGNERHPRRAGNSGVLNALFGGDYRYTESRIHADEWLYVLGWFETVHAPSRGEQAKVHMQKLLNEWKQDRAALLARFDSNGDGQLDLQEWERARSEAAQQAQHYALLQPDLEPVNTLSRPPLRDRPYLIAAHEPKQLAQRYRLSALLALAVGFGIAALIGWDYLRA